MYAHTLLARQGEEVESGLECRIRCYTSASIIRVCLRENMPRITLVIELKGVGAAGVGCWVVCSCGWSVKDGVYQASP